MRKVRTVPGRLAGIAALLVAVYLVCHLLGLRDSVGLLSGTMPASRLELFAGTLTVLAWFAAVLVAPVLGIAAGLHLAVLAVARRTLGARREEQTLSR